MKQVRIALTLVMMLLITLGFSFFINISSGGVALFVEQMGESPGWLYDLMVKPYKIWIGMAWISFFINAGPIFLPLLRKQDPIDYFSGSVFHLMWIGLCFIWHVTGMISPFFTIGYMIQ